MDASSLGSVAKVMSEKGLDEGKSYPDTAHRIKVWSGPVSASSSV